MLKHLDVFFLVAQLLWLLAIDNLNDIVLIIYIWRTNMNAVWNIDPHQHLSFLSLVSVRQMGFVAIYGM